MTASSESCVFCQIVAGSAPSSEIHRDELCVAFMDLHPINAGHALICPTRHVVSFVDLRPVESEAIMRMAQRVARAQRETLPGCSGVNVILSDGEAAGQEVAHAHFHIVPRERGDGFGWRRFGGRSTREDLDAIAARLRHA